MVSTQFATSYPPAMGGPLNTHAPLPPPPPSLSPPASKKRSSIAPPPPPTSVPDGIKKPKLTKTPPPPPPPLPPPIPPTKNLSQNSIPPPPPSAPPQPSSISTNQKSLPQGGIQRLNTSTSVPPPPPPPPSSNKSVENSKKMKVSPPPPPPPTAPTTSSKSLTPPLPSTLTQGRFNSNMIRSGNRGCRDVSQYERVRQVGKGAYGEVFMARCKRTNKMVALKKLLMVSPEREGFPIYSIREINILNRMKKHENIVNLVEIVTCGGRKASSSASPGEEDEGSSIFMVFEYLEFDLQGLLSASKMDPNVNITSHHIRSWACQLLEGINYLHQNKVIHRDLKGNNILIGSNNCLKIADFGLARPLSENVSKYTPNMMTLGFRPPELLMGMPKYNTSADMWSIGVILAEMLLRKPLFPVYPGQTEIDHLVSIFDICGTPKLNSLSSNVSINPDYHYDIWSNVENDCPNYKINQHVSKPRLLQNKFDGNAHEIKNNMSVRVGKSNISVSAVDLVEKMLCLDPKKRISANVALEHEYFFKDGEVKKPDLLPKLKLTSAHDLETRNKEQEIRDKLKAQREKAMTGLAQQN